MSNFIPLNRHQKKALVLELHNPRCGNASLTRENGNSSMTGSIG